MNVDEIRAILDLVREHELAEFELEIEGMTLKVKKAGDGSWSADDVAQALAARDRAACGQVAPPDGLCLMKVDYPS